MNEVKSNQAMGVLPIRAASSKGGGGEKAQVTVAGNALPVVASDDQGVKVEKPVLSSSEMNRMVARMNEFVQKEQRDLQFSVDDTTGMTVVKVTDRTSGDLIRQIPNQVFLDLATDALKNEPISLISVYS